MTERNDKPNKKRQLERELVQRGETYAFCSRHNRRYPRGAACPNCAAEAKSQKK